MFGKLHETIEKTQDSLQHAAVQLKTAAAMHVFHLPIIVHDVKASIKECMSKGKHFNLQSTIPFILQ